jgi:hypothetical protein
MKDKLKASRLDYEFRDDEGGYHFDVVASRGMYGWGAEVKMSAGLGMNGFKTPEAAIKHVALAAKEFVRQVKAAKE